MQVRQDRFRSTFFLVCLCTVVLCSPGYAAGPGPAATGKSLPAHKKLIAFAVNAVEPAYLRKHIEELERVLPLDGLVIFVYPNDWGQVRNGQEALFFGGRRFASNDFSNALADLKATRFNRFTDNFIQCGASAVGSWVTKKVEDGNMDWFAPNWSVVAQNGAVAARLAKEAGFKGIFLDLEYYKGGLGPWNNLFDHNARPDKDKRSLAEVEAQVRLRGQEWMQAVVESYPDITIIIIPSSGWERHNMVEPFVRGMLERRGKATLIDGGEGGYSMVAPRAFSELRERAESCHRKDKLFKSMQYAFGVWVDPTPNAFGGWHTNPVDFHKNYRSPTELAHTLHGALAAADRYAWIYVWHPDVWYNPTVRPRPMNHQCRTCPPQKGATGVPGRIQELPQAPQPELDACL